MLFSIYLFIGALLVVGSTQQQRQEQQQRYAFEEVVLSANHTLQTRQWRTSNATLVFASSVLKQPVYISMATMKSRINRVHKTIISIFEGALLPDRLYLFISKEGFLLDAGVAVMDIPQELKDLVTLRHWPISIVYTDNIGSHRKLLPLLSAKWREDCAIATFDDEPKDEGKLKQYLSQLVRYYVASNREAVVSLKARRIGLCRSAPWNVRNYGYWTVASAGKRELFLLPTGTGSVLYRPRFFHSVVFDPFLRNLTYTADDLMFRLSTLAKGIAVVTGCRDDYQRDRQLGRQTVVQCPASAVLFGPEGDPTLRYAPAATPSLVIAQAQAQAQLNVSIHRRRLQSLAQLNLHKQGNDRAWRSATAYLLDRGVLNLTALALKVMPSERGRACDPTVWELEPLKRRTDELGKRLLKQRRECSLTFCQARSDRSLNASLTAAFPPK